MQTHPTMPLHELEDDEFMNMLAGNSDFEEALQQQQELAECDNT